MNTTINFKGRDHVLNGLEHKHKVWMFKEIQRWLIENQCAIQVAKAAFDYERAKKLKLTNDQLISDCDAIHKSIAEDGQPPIYEKNELKHLRKGSDMIVSRSTNNILDEIISKDEASFYDFVKQKLISLGLKNGHQALAEFINPILKEFSYQAVDILEHDEGQPGE